jgi:hypothetical protein
MNQVLREVALTAGAPVEMLDQLWFNIFCMKFADALLDMAEKNNNDIQ